jgi:hypothetical protein
MSNNSRQKNQLTHFAEMVWAAPARAAGIGIARTDIPRAVDEALRDEATATDTLRHAIRQRSTGAKA